MQFDLNLDEKIITIIEKNGTIRYNRLFQMLCYEKRISKRTYNNHIQRLKGKQIVKIEKSFNPEGIGLGETLISLTQNTILKKGLFRHVELDYKDVKRLSRDERGEEIKKERENEERTRLLLFLLLQTSLGYVGYKNKDPNTRIEPGDIISLNSETASPSVISSTIAEEGFSSVDLHSIYRGISLSPIKGFFGSNRFKKSEEDEIIQQIEEKYSKNFSLKISGTGLRGEIRYRITDDKLLDLLSGCALILRLLVNVMCEYCLVLGIVPQHEDFRWLNFVAGEETASKLLNQIQMNRKQKKTLKEIYIESRGLNKLLKNNNRLLNAIIESDKKKRPELFSKKTMERIFSKHLFKSGILYLEINRIKKNVTQLKSNKNYDFILDEIKSIINPPFTKKWYQLNFNSDCSIN